jgi:hypothetical protein
MHGLLATAERAGSLVERIWGVFVLGLTLVTASLAILLALTALGVAPAPPGLLRARPWIAGLGILTMVVLLVAYLGNR